jgi:hypothetical protein
VTAAAVSIVVLLVGLPLLAFWLGGLRSWSRLRPGRDADPWGDVVREHRLTAGEAATVTAAVNRGRRLEDERLRRAAVDLARQALAGSGWRAGGRVRRVVLLLVALWLLLQVVGIVIAVATRGLDDVPWVSVVALIGGAVALVAFRRRLRRAVQVNTGPPPD